MYLTFDYIKNYIDMDWMESFEPTPYYDKTETKKTM